MVKKFGLLLTVLTSLFLMGNGLRSKADGVPGAQTAFVDGQVVLYCQPGTSQNDVNALAAKVNAQQVIPLLLKDCYELILPAANATDAGTLNAVAALKGDPRVRWVGPNRIFHLMGAPPTATPNDPHYTNGDQWPLPQINMPAAWAIEKGTANVADIDTGFDNTHPDLTGQYIMPGYNAVDGSTNNAPGGTDPENQHGVSTSSIMVAITNNNIGMASICGWGSTKCLGIKAGDANGFTETALVNASQYVLNVAQQDNIVVVNESLGGPGDPTDTSDPYYQATKALSDAGIIVVAAAGNDSSDNHQTTPAGFTFPNLLTVSALNRNSQLTYYSSFGKVDISAPGGEQTSDNDPNGFLVAVNGSYAFEQGTSFAAPVVSGVIALLRSVPGVTPTAAIQAIEQSANHIITGQQQVPDPKYGYGEVDAYQALLRVIGHVEVDSPIGIDNATGLSTDPSGNPPPPVETLKPTFTFGVRNIPLSNINIAILNPDGTTTPLVTNGTPAAGVSNFSVTGDTTSSYPVYSISFRYAFNTVLASSQVTVQITGTPANPNIPTPQQTVTFNLQPHRFPAGLSLISIPIYESATDSPTGSFRNDIRQILSDPTAVLYSWGIQPSLNSAGQATAQGVYTPTPGTVGASASFTSSGLPASSTPETNPPLGLGFFLKTTASDIYRTYGNYITSQFVNIPLHEGWNLVGDPFPFAVSFNICSFETPGGTLYSAEDAAKANLILPFIYRYVGGSYQFDTLPQGLLRPWEGSWIYVIPANPNSLSTSYVLTMVVPPTGSTSDTLGRAANTSVPSSGGPNNWRLQLVAASGSAVDGHNYIGVSAQQTDPSFTRAPKPPQLTNEISLSILEQGRGTQKEPYAMSLHAPATTQTWQVLVQFANKGTLVTVSWPNIAQVPHNIKLVLTDQTTGQQIDMRTRSAYQFLPTAQETSRQFQITASTSVTGGRPLISDLFVDPVNSNRAAGPAGFDIRYNISRDASVDIEVLASNGRVVGMAQPSRAVTAGANHAFWNGRDLAGNPVPTGVYIIQLRAVTSTGDVTRQTIPLTIAR
ncbi:MAG TPA: S8 family serine peptidase [Chthonomonas sp.]|uniref:S8 family serine peptidase n=1 Tax=Chthonomonas sp. TaxID=2282153 RepID=UPI002B4B6EFB|nr:S8 family serine peptidase [Chthonomonas sp.]HLH81068.1 S8 family serine peptidase [Chthonomonas sp.]